MSNNPYEPRHYHAPQQQPGPGGEPLGYGPQGHWAPAPPPAKRPWYTRKRWWALAALVVLIGAAAAIARDDSAPPDPYEVYLRNAPERPVDWAGEWPLSREDAQVRALLGCDQEWAPGTIDAALQAAYC